MVVKPFCPGNKDTCKFRILIHRNLESGDQIATIPGNDFAIDLIVVISIMCVAVCESCSSKLLLLSEILVYAVLVKLTFQSFLI